MKAQYDHKVLASFETWLNHQILTKGEAYTTRDLTLYGVNTSTSMEYKEDTLSPSGYGEARSHYGQWVYDTSVATIPHEIVVDGDTYDRDDNVIFDFVNGRVLTQSDPASDPSISYGTEVTISNMPIKEINTYITTKSESKLYDEIQQGVWPNFEDTINADNVIPPHSVIMPCIFIRLVKRYNDPLCFGSTHSSKYHIRCICFGSDWQITGLQAILADLKSYQMPILYAGDLPLNQFGDLKNRAALNDNFGEPFYDYLGERIFLTPYSWLYDFNYLINPDYNIADRLCYVDDVAVSAYESDIISDHHPGLRMAFAEFTLAKHREIIRN